MPPPPDTKPNVLFVLMDGCEYSIFANPEEGKALAPNLSKLIDQGMVQRLVANGMITQVSLPTILTQTYPFDYGGYNYGIKNRPRSLIEDLKASDYETYFLCSSDITGPNRNYERGCDVVRRINDINDVLPGFIKVIVYYEIHKYNQGILTKQQLLDFISSDLDGVLRSIEAAADRSDSSFLHKRFRRPSVAMTQKVRQERELLARDPEAVLYKIERVPSIIYEDFLGEDLREQSVEKMTRRVQWSIRKYETRAKVNYLFKRYSGIGFSPFANYYAPTATEVFNEALAMLPAKTKKPWYLFIQLLDFHDGPKTSRVWRFLECLINFPKVKKIRKSFPTHRDIWRDLCMVYMDKRIGRFLKALDQRGQLENTKVVMFGDHGMGWDLGRGKPRMEDLGFRVHHEHLVVPLIVSPTNRTPQKEGVHDGMSVSATVYDELGLSTHESHKGVSAYQSGKWGAIAESVGRGNCDLVNRELYFAVESAQYKILLMMVDNQIKVQALYDLYIDPREHNNLLFGEEAKERYKNVIAQHIEYLMSERKEIFELRNVDVEAAATNYEILDVSDADKRNPLRFNTLPTMIKLGADPEQISERERPPQLQ